MERGLIHHFSIKKQTKRKKLTVAVNFEYPSSKLSRLPQKGIARCQSNQTRRSSLWIQWGFVGGGYTTHNSKRLETWVRGGYRWRRLQWHYRLGRVWTILLFLNFSIWRKVQFKLEKLSLKLTRLPEVCRWIWCVFLRPFEVGWFD